MNSPWLHVILYQPEIAANAGAIGRTCVAVGARLWLVRPLGFRLSDRLIRRAGLDYWDRLDLRLVDGLDEIVQSLGHDRIWSFSTKGPRRYTDVTYRAGDGLLFGPESRGLPDSWLKSQDDRVLRIPILPEARSLNLASSVAIAVFEGMRQLEFQGLAIP